MEQYIDAATQCQCI